MPVEEKSKTVKVSGREIIGTRIFDSPPEQVWQAWTDPKVITLWWGPRGFSTTTSKMEFRPKGVWQFVMHGPDGRDYNNKVIYDEVKKPEKLVYHHTGEDGTEPVKFQVFVTFEKMGSKTKLNIRMVFESVAELKNVEKYGAVEGLVDTLERLGEYLSVSTNA